MPERLPFRHHLPHKGQRSEQCHRQEGTLHRDRSVPGKVNPKRDEKETQVKTDVEDGFPHHLAPDIPHRSPYEEQQRHVLEGENVVLEKFEASEMPEIRKF